MSNGKNVKLDAFDYNNLKNKIDYEINKNLISKSKFDIKENEKIMTIKDIEFKTSQYLLNMLLNGNKYIIIDSIFWKVICEKGKENSTVINYSISEHTQNLNLNLKNDKSLIFDNKKRNNILELSK